MNYQNHTPKVQKSKVASKNQLPTIVVDGAADDALRYWEAGISPFPMLRRSLRSAMLAHRHQYPPHGLYHNRLHYCTGYCPTPCPKDPKLNPDKLFRGCNIGVMLGKPSNYLTAIIAKSYDAMQDVEDILHEHMQRVAPYACYLTPANHGAVFFVYVRDNEVANMETCKIPGVAIWGHRRWVLMPHSLLPSGHVLRWQKGHSLLDLDPEKDSVRGKWLVGRFGAKLLGRPDYKLKFWDYDADTLWEIPQDEWYTLPSDLPSWAYEITMNSRQNLLHGGGSSYRQRMLMCCEIASLGVSQDDLLTQLLTYYPDGDEKWEDMIMQSISEAYSQPRQPTLLEWQKVYNFVEVFLLRHQWTGRTAHSEIQVIHGLLARMRMDRDVIFRATKRELADLLGLDQKTCYDTVQRLAGKNPGNTPIILEKAGKNDIGASLYRFRKDVLMTVFNEALNNPLMLNTIYTSSPTDNSIPDDNGSNGKDVKMSLINNGLFRAYSPDDDEQEFIKKHGMMTFKVWKVLSYQPEPTQKAIAGRVGINVRHTREALRHLKNLGLVYKDEQDNWAAYDIYQMEGDDALSQQNKRVKPITKVDSLGRKRVYRADDWSARHRYMFQRERELDNNRAVRRYLDAMNATVKGKR